MKRKYIFILLIAVIPFFLMSSFLGLESIQINNNSMSPDYPVNSKSIVIRNPILLHKGVEVLHLLPSSFYEFAGPDSLLINSEYLHRIIGIPGDQVLIKGTSLFVDDSEVLNNIPERFVKKGLNIKLKDNEYFLISINPEEIGKTDSLSVGPITKNLIVGRVLVK